MADPADSTDPGDSTDPVNPIAARLDRQAERLRNVCTFLAAQPEPELWAVHEAANVRLHMLQISWLLKNADNQPSVNLTEAAANG